MLIIFVFVMSLKSLMARIVMCVGFLSAVIVQSTSSKTKYVLTAMNLSGSGLGLARLKCM